jgi:hypothetical protein
LHLHYGALNSISYLRDPALGLTDLFHEISGRAAPGKYAITLRYGDWTSLEPLCYVVHQALA